MTEDPVREMLVSALRHYDLGMEAPGPAMREFELSLAFGFAIRAHSAIVEKTKAASAELDSVMADRFGRRKDLA